MASYGRNESAAQTRLVHTRVAQTRLAQTRLVHRRVVHTSVVPHKKKIIFVSLLAVALTQGILCSAEKAKLSTESFVVEKACHEEKGPAKKFAKARQEAVQHLEGIAHTLTHHIKDAAEVLDEVLLRIRKTIEGNASDLFVKALKKDRIEMVDHLKMLRGRLDGHHRYLIEVKPFIKRGFTQSKKK